MFKYGLVHNMQAGKRKTNINIGNNFASDGAMTKRHHKK